MNRGFFSAVIALLVLSVSFAVILSSPALQQTTAIPTESTLFSGKVYVWAALDQTIAKKFFEMGPTCVPNLTAINSAVLVKLQELGSSLGFSCLIDSSPTSITTNVPFSYRYHCTGSAGTFRDELVEQYTFSITGTPPACVVQDVFIN